MDLSVVIALVSTCAFVFTFIRHILFKRELFKLKEDMKQHTLKHGVDNQLWLMFVERTRGMFSFWR